MPARDITISTDPIDCGHRFWLKLYVYDTTDELQKAAYRYGNESVAFWSKAAACFQPRMVVAYDKKGNAVRTRRTSFIGVMRLAREDLNYQIMIHESVHAAINLVRSMRLDPDPDFGDIENEEALAHATHHISHAVIEAMRSEME